MPPPSAYCSFRREDAALVEAFTNGTEQLKRVVRIHGEPFHEVAVCGAVTRGKCAGLY